MSAAAIASLSIPPLPQGRASALSADVVCPPDKSMTHRALMFAGMARGLSDVRAPLTGADCLSTMAVLRALGVSIALRPDGSSVAIDSPGWDAWNAPTTPLDYGNSGTTARLMMGLLAASPGLFTVAWGDPSLSGRPMRRVVDPLRHIGASIHGRRGGELLPLAIEGRLLRAGEHRVDKASAQVKSALLLAGCNVDGETQVRLPSGGRDHTEKMLRAMGAKLQVERSGGEELIVLRGPFRPVARTYAVPGDPSSAAFLVALGVLSASHFQIRGVLENPTRTGALTVLERMGANLSRTPTSLGEGLDLEPVVDVEVRGGVELRGVDVEAELAPTLIDEVPILAVVAAFARGPTRLRGLAELRVKESDRLSATLELLHAAGAKAHAEGDDLVIEGGLECAQPFSYDPRADHRLAMAAAILAHFAASPCRLADPDCTAVSFPGFFDVLSRITGSRLTRLF